MNLVFQPFAFYSYIRNDATICMCSHHKLDGMKTEKPLWAVVIAHDGI